MNNFYLRFNREIWQNSDLNLQQKLILNFVWNFCLKSGYCYASNQYIAEVFGMYVEEVYLTITRLLDNEHIKVIPHPEKRLLTVNTKLYPLSE